MDIDPDEEDIKHIPEIPEPFEPVTGPSIIYTVSAGAGRGKTTNALHYAALETRIDGKTIFALPTVKVIREKVEDLKRIAKELGISIKPEVITKEWKTVKTVKLSVPEAICEFIGTAEGGQILFVTHEGLLRIAGMPEEVSSWHLIIDEVFDPILSSGVIKLRYSHFNLGRPDHIERGFGFIRTKALPETLGDDEKTKDLYYQIVPILDTNNEEGDPWFNIRMHMFGQDNDEVYKIFKSVPLWILQGEPLFTHAANWVRMTTGLTVGETTMRKGNFTICGFRRPNRFLKFRRVTIMSALFESTMLHNLWSKLGIQFKPSPDIKLIGNTTSLGARRLRIGWLTDAIWSKASRNKSKGTDFRGKETSGIEVVFQVIGESNIIDDKEKVGIVVNKDDQALIESRSGNALPLIKTLGQYFRKREFLPHNVRGSNEWTHLHQLIHTAALNSNATDIKWIESALGIDSLSQRLGRVGHEIYQTFMRLSIRLPKSTIDLTLVVMEKLIAEWMATHFTPQGQIEIIEIDGKGRIAKPKPVGRPKGSTKSDKEKKNKDAAERMKKYRERKKTKTV